MSRAYRMRAKLLVVAGVATAVAPFVPTGPASAHTFIANSSISIHREGNRFFGRVDSRRRSCERNRVVKLVKIKKNGDRVVVGTDDETSNNGAWTVRASRRGRFQAVVKARTGGPYGHSHTCRGDRSRIIRRGRPRV
jgi:hypothetical protein